MNKKEFSSSDAILVSPPHHKTQFFYKLRLSAFTLLYHVASTGKLAQLVSPATTLARLIGTWSTKQTPVATGSVLSNSITTTGLMILPLAPALFISGIHFLAAFKARHTLTQLANHHHHHTHTKHAQRSFLATFLLIRERRLDWLVHQIRSFEQTQEPGKKNNKTCSPQPLLDLGPSTTATQEMRISMNPWLAFGPDLSHLDMDAFLRDPTERARVLCMELRATREELAVFMAGMPTKITHT